MFPRMAYKAIQDAHLATGKLQIFLQMANKMGLRDIDAPRGDCPKLFMGNRLGRFLVAGDVLRLTGWLLHRHHSFIPNPHGCRPGDCLQTLRLPCRVFWISPHAGAGQVQPKARAD